MPLLVFLALSLGQDADMAHVGVDSAGNLALNARGRAVVVTASTWVNVGLGPNLTWNPAIFVSHFIKYFYLVKASGWRTAVRRLLQC